MTTSRLGVSAPRLYSAWLAMPDHGPRAVRFGDELATALHHREVLYHQTPLDSFPDVPTYCYLHFVLVLENAASVSAAVAAVEQYRHFRPPGLPAVITGTVHESQAGIVQVVAPSSVLAALKGNRIARAFCATHDLDNVRVGDVLSAAVRPPLPRETGVSDLSVSALENLWRSVRSRWNFPTDISCVPLLLATIMRCRVHCEDPHRPAMYRPLSHIERHATQNRFDLILDPATRDEVPERMWKSYTENGATIVREYIVPAILKAFPEARLPTHGHRGAQPAVKDLVESLELLLAHPDCKSRKDHEPRDEE